MEEADPFEADDTSAFRSPPPPDDRLWRHPSELGGTAGAGVSGRGTRRTWPVAVLSGLAGAVLTVGFLTASGTLDGRSRDVVVREAVRTAAAGLDRSGWGDDDVLRIAAAASPAVVRLEVGGDEPSIGSGVLFRDDGLLLTNAHVLGAAVEVRAVLASGATVRAQVMGRDTETDIAVVKLDGDGPFPTAVLGSTHGMAVGQLAVAVGPPVGLTARPTATAGVISAIGREVRAEGGPALVDMIQTDAPVSAGSSGGALLDRTGAVVGITTAYALRPDGTEGLGYATPVEVARAVGEELLAVGRVRAAWLGVRGTTDGDGAGARVVEAVPGSPAADSGLRAGDVIRRVDGRPVMTMSALRIGLRRLHPGDRTRVVFDRDGDRRELYVTLAERP